LSVCLSVVISCGSVLHDSLNLIFKVNFNLVAFYLAVAVSSYDDDSDGFHVTLVVVLIYTVNVDILYCYKSLCLVHFTVNKSLFNSAQ